MVERMIDLAGMHLPLNIDFLTPLISTVSGSLNAAGYGTSVLPVGGLVVTPALIGVTLSSAAVLITSGFLLGGFSNDENVRIEQ